MVQLPQRSYSVDFKQNILAKYLKSGLSLKAFARQEDIPDGTLRGWVRNDPRNPSRIRKKKTDFIPITTKSQVPQSIANLDITLEYPNGVKLNLSGDIDSSQFSALIKFY